MPFNNDRFRLIGFFPAPAHLPAAQFKQDFEKLVDAVVACPIGRKNFLHYDLIFANSDLDQHVNHLGFVEVPLHALILVETQTEAEMAEVLHDAQFRQILARANGKLNFTGGHCFTGDLLKKVDKAKL
ncbi:hypothetical protein C8R43DRAFT_1116622 [Mycena crocata]|nr:hypothetical protein C8R43DRAFT_1116622 [Mycena crocata]